jgi:restriction system protein
MLVTILSYEGWLHRAALIYTAAALIIVGTGLVVTKLIRASRAWWATRNPKMRRVDQMTGLQFEQCVAGLLKAQGYHRIRLTEQFDYGVDITAEKDGIHWGIQVKRNSGLVGANAVRQAVTALNIYGCDRAMVITNSSYSYVATELAVSNGCVLIGRDTLTKWVARGRR